MRQFCFGLLLAIVVPSYAQVCKTWHDSSQHRIQFVTVEDGVRLEVLDWGGTGPPIVLLSGYTTAHVFDDFAPQLTGFAHIYGITRRGLGSSSHPGNGYTAKQSAGDVLRVLDFLKLDRPILAGHSFGGQDLNVIAADHPKRVAGIVYLASAEDISLGPVTHAEIGHSASELPEQMRHRPEPDMSSFSAYRAWQIREQGMAFPESELRQEYACNPDGSLGEYVVSKEVRDALFAGLTAPEYSRIQVPVLAFFALPKSLEGQLERFRPQTIAEGAAMGLKYGLDLAWIARNEDALKRSVPRARLVELAKGNVFVFLTNQSEVVRELHDFVVGLH